MSTRRHFPDYCFFPTSQLLPQVSAVKNLCLEIIVPRHFGYYGQFKFYFTSAPCSACSESRHFLDTEYSQCTVRTFARSQFAFHHISTITSPMSAPCQIVLSRFCDADSCSPKVRPTLKAPVFSVPTSRSNPSSP